MTGSEYRGEYCIQPLRPPSGKGVMAVVMLAEEEDVHPPSNDDGGGDVGSAGKSYVH